MLEDEISSLFLEGIFLKYSWSHFSSVVLGRGIRKIIYNNAVWFRKLRKAAREVDVHEHSIRYGHCPIAFVLTAVSFRHAYPLGRLN